MTETYGSDPKIWKQEGSIVQTVYVVRLPWVSTTVAMYLEEFPTLLVFRWAKIRIQNLGNIFKSDGINYKFKCTLSVRLL
jgi:hypothetical protein